MRGQRKGEEKKGYCKRESDEDMEEERWEDGVGWKEDMVRKECGER